MYKIQFVIKRRVFALFFVVVFVFLLKLAQDIFLLWLISAQVLASKVFYDWTGPWIAPCLYSSFFFYTILCFPALIKPVGRVCSLLPTKHCDFYGIIYLLSRCLLFRGWAQSDVRHGNRLNRERSEKTAKL